MTMLQLAGPAAETAFRLQRLRAELEARSTGVADLAVEFRHYVHVDAPLSAAQLAVLEALLAYGAAAETTHIEPALYIVPRLGTISPWASKATDIARMCGLPVHRIERGRVVALRTTRKLERAELLACGSLLHDRMTETVLLEPPSEQALFGTQAPRPAEWIALGNDGAAALERANRALGLALAQDEIEYLAAQYRALDRDPSDVELMMFAQANSEHCRHKVFNAAWIVDGEPLPKSLFQMIRNTHARA